MSHIPQKLHFAKSMSIFAFLAFSLAFLGCFIIVIASFGQAREQITQPIQKVLLSVNLKFLTCKSQSNVNSSGASVFKLLNGTQYSHSINENYFDCSELNNSQTSKYCPLLE